MSGMWQVGIIGSGNIGRAVGRRLAALGHEVRMANSRGPASLADEAARHAIMPATLAEAARARDFVLIAIPEGAVAALPGRLFADTDPATVVLDAGNYYPGVRDAPIAPIEAGMADSAWVAERIDRPVIKMFNTIHAGTIASGGRPAGAPGRICLPIAGDDPAAKAKALALAEALGFDGLDAGTLALSWRQQPGTPGYCRDLDRPSMIEALAAAEDGEAEAYREIAMARARGYATAAAAGKAALPGQL